MNGIILYQSEYGSTKQYAEWLSEETGFAIKEVMKDEVAEVLPYDVIILGGGIHASGITGLSFLKKNYDSLKGKYIAVFCCGASPYEEDAFHQLTEHNMKGPLAEIPLFYCRGAWDINVLTFKDRIFCNLVRNAIEKKDPAEYEPWEKVLMVAGDNTCDWKDREQIKPIVEWIRMQVHS